MTCGIPAGVELFFLNSGIRIQPAESNIEREGASYATGTFKLTKPAGELVGRKVEPGEPILFLIDGWISHRFVFEGGSLEFRHSTTRSDEAILDVPDASAVLDRGVISKSFSNTRLSTIIEYIVDNRDDSLGVIREVEFAESDSIDFSQEAQPYAEIGGVGKMYSTASDVPIRGPFATAIEFDNISPLQALKKTAERFQFDFWVTPLGYLKVGLNQIWGNVVEIIENTEIPSIQRLDIIESSNPVSEIMIKGPTAEGFQWFPKGSLRSNATAKADGIDGSSASIELDSTPELSQLENVAGRALLRKIMEDASGSIVFNGMASEDTKNLAEMTVGDHIIIGDNVFESCEIDPPAGHYTIKKVHHRINPRQGWRIRTDIARVPTDISTTSWYYDPLDEKRYETIEAYESHVRESEFDEQYVT